MVTVGGVTRFLPKRVTEMDPEVGALLGDMAVSVGTS
jgi:hypothetical protein